MANPSMDEVRLQLAMAFGQGAGVMMAAPDAMASGFSSQSTVVTRATENWELNRWALITLVRLSGQIAAAKAAVEGQTEIGSGHIQFAIEAVLGVCPCVARNERK